VPRVATALLLTAALAACGGPGGQVTAAAPAQPAAAPAPSPAPVDPAVDDDPVEVSFAIADDLTLIAGTVTAAGDGAPVAGVTVVATSPALAGTLTAITENDGGYALRDLPVGHYQLTFYFAEVTMERGPVPTRRGKGQRVDVELPVTSAGAAGAP
jgi:hypothetical protein